MGSKGNEMKNLIAVMTIVAFMLGVAIVCETPSNASSEEVIVEYYNQVEEVIEEEDNEVEFESDFEYYNWLVGYAAELKGIDPKLAIAISRLETGNWKNIKKHYNFGGLSVNEKPMTFNSEVEGLERYINLLVWYQEKGMDTPEKMSKVYCPNNESWAKQVRQIMEEI